MSDSEPQPDDMLTFADIARLIVRPGMPPINRSTFTRWIKDGVRAGKSKVKLVAESIGGRWFVRWSDWLAFKEEVTRRKGGETERIETPAERKRESKRLRAQYEEIFGPIHSKPRKRRAVV